SAEVFRGAGYFTAMTGKWHLNQEPTDFGFERYFGHLSGACNYFRGDKTFRLNGQPWTVPEQGFYTTVANVDFALDFLSEARRADQPWYLYVAFNAPHAPLQALPEDYHKYAGRYDLGWDAIRQSRFRRQQELGVLEPGVEACPRPDHIPSWDSLSEPRKRFESKRMATLAAMIDRVDQEIGRIVSNLRETGELENTIIWFVSDNGACPYDRISQGVEAEPTSADVTYSDSTGWACVRNTPFRFYKQNQFEGGIATPAIVHWPAGLKLPAGSMERTPAHLIDILPTLTDIADLEIPQAWPGRELRPVSGISLRPVLEGGQLLRPEPLHFLFAADRAIRDGHWKAVSFRSGPWELYDLERDRTELHDLSKQNPQRLESLVQQWQDMARDVLHADRQAMRPVNNDFRGYSHPEWTDFSSDPVEGRRGNGKGGNGKGGHGTGGNARADNAKRGNARRSR
ncbi:MAG: sulfatase-like hydrolase/transferase, partial [bacterium]|nr:sulfatase-like hydrolase/transferase [bacterium]